ncbi:hypothetical protein [Actinacidiphila oryziradicis]|uniref:hypothetical protein n=1 Tax=Actinacidiphila oryziradicis TaxID=2571141 RepID=UPI00145EFEEC|nr:hypothetical protein [Actinacidiphila oryziradicis]
MGGSGGRRDVHVGTEPSARPAAEVYDAAGRIVIPALRRRSWRDYPDENGNTRDKD